MAAAQSVTAATIRFGGVPYYSRTRHIYRMIARPFVDNSCGSAKSSNRVCRDHDAEETAPKAALLVEHYRHTLVAHSVPDDLTQGHPGFENGQYGPIT
jgi:ribosomal protein L32